jgi:phage gpG-like protein
VKSFSSLAGMAQHLVLLEATTLASINHGLEKAARKVEKRAKAKIGTYQDGDAAGHPAWAELAESTKADRVRKGYSENDPLLRSGKLRDSISHHTDHLVAVIGSNEDVAVWQELGTNKIPPRPFLGTALYESIDDIKKIVGGAVVSGIVGGKVLSHKI